MTQIKPIILNRFAGIYARDLFACDASREYVMDRAPCPQPSR